MLTVLYLRAVRYPEIPPGDTFTPQSYKRRVETIQTIIQKEKPIFHEMSHVKETKNFVACKCCCKQFTVFTTGLKKVF